MATHTHQGSLDRALRHAARLLLVLLLLAITLPAAAQSSRRSSPPPPPPPEPPSYPTVTMEHLTDDQLQQVRRVAEGMLCPCAGRSRSLHVCLETDDGACGLAREAGWVLVSGIRGGADDVSLAASIERAIDDARQVRTFALDQTPWKGAARPSVTIVEFADFECPSCRRMVPALNHVLRRFPDHVRVYFKHYPIPGHPNAMEAAIAASAAHRQDRFWEFHDRLFEHQSELQAAADPLPMFEQWAQELDMDLEQFERDMRDPAIYQAIQAQREEGARAGVSGTPTLYINGVRVLEGLNPGALEERIRTMIR